MSPRAVVFDGSQIWTANLARSTVTRLQATDGTNLGTFAVGSALGQWRSNGANIWVANFSSNTVSNR